METGDREGAVEERRVRIRNRVQIMLFKLVSTRLHVLERNNFIKFRK